MYSAYKLNKQDDNIQSWHTSFPIWNQSVIPCLVLTVASWPVCQEAGQVVWYAHLFQNFPQFIVIHTVKGFGIVNKAEIDVFLELSCLFNDPTHVGNLNSGSSAFSKTSLNIWKFTVHVLLKPGLENFEHYFTSMWDERLGCLGGINTFKERRAGTKTEYWPSVDWLWRSPSFSQAIPLILKELRVIFSWIWGS